MIFPIVNSSDATMVPVKTGGTATERWIHVLVLITSVGWRANWSFLQHVEKCLSGGHQRHFIAQYFAAHGLSSIIETEEEDFSVLGRQSYISRVNEVRVNT